MNGTIWTRAALAVCLLGSASLQASADVDAKVVRRHIDNLGSRSAAMRAGAARSLIEIGKSALPELEAAAKRDALSTRTALVEDLLDQIRWSVDLVSLEERFVPPPAELLDVTVLADLGLAPRAQRNPTLVAFLTRRIRAWDEDAVRPTGQTPALTGQLVALDRMRAGRKTPFDAVEKRAKELLTRFTSPPERGRIVAAVAHVYGQSGCPPRTLVWTQRALELPLDPATRVRTYEYAYSATLLKTKPSSRRETPEGRRELLRPSLFGLRETQRYDLPATAPELTSITHTRDESEQTARLHRRQVQARVVSRAVREMTTFRDIHRDRVSKHATRTAAEREELRKLLDRPEVLRALARALRRGEDVADGLRIAREATVKR